MDKIFEQVFEWAKCGIYHNYAEGEFREANLKILKLVEEKYTLTKKQSTPCCASCGNNLDQVYWCYDCNSRAVPK
jgi:hypothetical protein